MDKVVDVKVLPRYRLKVEFDDGVAGEIDLLPTLTGPMAQPLKDEAYFRKVFIDEYGAIAWPNGFDLAPDALHDSLAQATTRSKRKKAVLQR